MNLRTNMANMANIAKIHNVMWCLHFNLGFSYHIWQHFIGVHHSQYISNFLQLATLKFFYTFTFRWKEGISYLILQPFQITLIFFIPSLHILFSSDLKITLQNPFLSSMHSKRIPRHPQQLQRHCLTFYCNIPFSVSTVILRLYFCI